MANEKRCKDHRKASKSSLARRKPSRSERKRALIICEDAVSAPNYFRKLINHFGLNTVDVKVCGEECGSAPASVVKYGVERLNNDKDFDYVFFVFDRDAHTTYDKALDRINGLKNQKNTRVKSYFMPLHQSRVLNCGFCCIIVNLLVPMVKVKSV